MITPNSAAVKQTAPAAAAPPKQNRILALVTGPAVKQRVMELMNDQTMTDRFIGVINSAVKTNPKLLECTEDTFLSCMLKSATLKLEPNDSIRQHCFLIPRWNSKRKVLECSWEAGAKGLIELAYRSNEVKAIAVQEIYERDIFDVDFGTNEVTHKLPKTDRFNRGAVEAYWAQWIGVDGVRGRPVIMTLAEMIEHRDAYAQSYKDEITRPYSPWTTAFDQMALKTVIKRCLKTAPLSSDDLRHGLDESDPQDDARYAWSVPQSAQPALSGGYHVDPMLVPDELYQTRTIDAEFENAPPEPPKAKQQPEPQEPPKAEPEPPPADKSEEEHTLEMFEKLKELIRTKRITGAVILEKCKVPASQLQHASLSELTKYYMDLSS